MKENPSRHAGARDGTSLIGSVHFIEAEREYFEGLQNELPGIEIEAKIGFLKPIQRKKVLGGLITHFKQAKGEFELFVPHILSTTNIIKKYKYSDGSFSVLNRKDGSRAIKRKRNKTKRPDSIIVSEEDRIELDPQDDPITVVTQNYDIPTDDISYLGTMARNKKYIVIKTSTQRIYTIVIDKSTVNDPVTNDQSVTQQQNNLTQLEIEYKGTEPSVSDSNEYSLQEKIEQLAGEINTIRNEIHGYLDGNTIPYEDTLQTKTNWLKQYKVA